MGLLDDLKRQAAEQQARQQDDSAQWERHAALVEAACKTVFQYWLELARHLNVLQPRTRVRHRLDARHVFEDMPMRDFHVDARRKTERGQSVHDYVQISCMLRTGRVIEVLKDMPHHAETLRARLRQSGIEHQAADMRDPDTGRFLHTRIEFKADFLAGVKLLPQHAQGTVHLRLANFEGFDTLLAEVPVIGVTQALLDELAKLMLGEPSRFVQMVRVLRRS